MRLLKRRHLEILSQRMRSTRTVLIGATSPMNIVVMRPIIDAFQADSRIALFVSGRYQGRDDPAALCRETGLTDIETVTVSEAGLLRADLFLSPDGGVFGKRVIRRVMMFHGASFKGRTISEKARRFHRVMLVGEYQRRIFVRRGIFEQGDPKLVSVGMPKLDPLVNGALDRRQLRATHSIGPDDLCVLYAPTWTEQSSLATMGEELIGTLAARPATKVLVKFHDHHLDPTRSSVDWRLRCSEWSWPNVSVIRDSNVVPALVMADMLVTDASSVAQEFTLLDRPIILVDVPELYQSDRYRDTHELSEWGQKSGITIREPGEAAAALDRCVEAPDELSTVRREVARDVFYNHGTATDTALDLLYRELLLRRPKAAREKRDGPA